MVDPKTIARTIWRFWGFIRQILAIRGLLQWAHWWEPVTAVLLALALGSWGWATNIPGPVTVLIVLFAFVLGLAVWRAWNIKADPSAPMRAFKEDLPVDDLPVDKPQPQCPRVIMQFVASAQLSIFELMARDADAFEIGVQPLVCKDAIIGWNVLKTVLLSGQAMPATICEIGKSGAYYNHGAPLLLECALDRLTSPDSPVVERSILITYRDAERQQWQTVCPIRYDRRIGKTEHLVPTFSLREAVPGPVKTDKDARRENFKTAHYRGAGTRSDWNVDPLHVRHD